MVSSAAIKEEANALYVVGKACTVVGEAAVPATVLLDTRADGYYYISADLAKELPNSVRTPVNVITTSFTKSIKSSSEYNTILS